MLSWTLHRRGCRPGTDWRQPLTGEQTMARLFIEFEDVLFSV
jgi:hypothetical protein